VDADSLGGDDRYDRDGYISPWGSSDALSDTATDDGALAIADCSEHVFFHADGLAIPDIQFSDSIENLNIFKRPAGAFGSAICADDEDPLEGYIQMRKQVGNDPVFTTKIDVDGYYTAGYSHKGKAIEFYLAWCADSNCNTEHERTAPFYLQSKGFVEINLLDLDYTAPICDGSEASLEDIGPIYSMYVGHTP
jgi:hypothetical protein